MSGGLQGATGVILDAVRVTHSVAQAIPDAASTPVIFNTERWDRQGSHESITNPSRLTCTVAGYYLIQGNLQWAAISAIMALRIRLNGITVIALKTRNASSSGETTLETTYALNVGDYVELLAYQNSGGPMNIQQNSNSSPEFMMHGVQGQYV